MGFSTSGAVAIMLIGFLLSASVIFPTVFATSSDTGEAFSSQADQSRERTNTDVDVRFANETDDAVTIDATNRGTTSVDLEYTDVLVNGDYVDSSETNATVIVDGDERTDTDIWPPGADLELEIDADAVDDPVERVQLTTPNGVSDATEEVE
ncbi:flagellin [Natrialbaceae archaeon GCM10025810]|uniref:flagellin n=1 Tax=Halovalidus salilacus TaxID=3075124 RepID=UPI0036119963